MDGLVVCSNLRHNPTTQDIPILMLTAKDDVRDRITGLDTGADDYLTKPFSFEELVARIRAVLRRQNRGAGEQGGDGRQPHVLQFGDLPLNLRTHEATRPGPPLQVTPTGAHSLPLF